MSVVCDSHIDSDCRKGGHKEGTVDFARLSCPWVYLEQNSKRPPVWKITSCILSLCQVDLTCGRLVRSQFSTILRWSIWRAAEWEMLFPTGPRLFKLFLLPSSEMPPAEALGLPSVRRRKTIIFMSVFHYPWAGNSSSSLWVLGTHDMPM